VRPRSTPVARFSPSSRPCRPVIVRRPPTSSPSPSFFLNAPAPTALYTLSLHDALPIYLVVLDLPRSRDHIAAVRTFEGSVEGSRSEEHTSELQSRFDLVCRLLLEKKNNA